LVGIDEDLSFYEGEGQGPDVAKGLFRNEWGVAQQHLVDQGVHH
jgi:hypothetical protein